MAELRNGQYKIAVEKRITTLETNYSNIERKIDELNKKFDTFCSNHFEHFKDEIYEKVEKTRGVQPWVATLFTVGGSLITGLIIYVVTHISK